MSEKMKYYDIIVVKLLYELGIHKGYKGVRYILSCITYISGNESTFSPVTKFLYVDVAKLHNTSKYSIENGIRAVITRIWTGKRNKALIEKIFGNEFLSTKPSNTIFLIALYNYIESSSSRTREWIDDYAFICPNCQKQCPFCKDILLDMISKRFC